MKALDSLMAGILDARPRYGRVQVNLCYAQSLDGSLTARPGEPTALSGPESSAFTHRLRAAHDAILVGVGTVLADDPRLTVRLVEGDNPQPVILDSHLRTPTQAYLLAEHPCPAWIATTLGAVRDRKSELPASGVRLLPLPEDEAGRVALPALLDRLGELGIGRLMVEGGAQVLTSFLAHKLADQVILTIAPRFTGGLHIGTDQPGAQDEGHDLELPSLKDVQYHRLGDDLIVWGRL